MAWLAFQNETLPSDKRVTTPCSNDNNGDIGDADSLQGR
jgi:hypothetical protein